MSLEELTGRELRRAAFAAIRKELGPEALVRFIAQNLSQPGRDYTEERREAPHLSVDEIISEYERVRAESGGSLAPRDTKVLGGEHGPQA